METNENSYRLRVIFSFTKATLTVLRVQLITNNSILIKTVRFTRCSGSFRRKIEISDLNFISLLTIRRRGNSLDPFESNGYRAPRVEFNEHRTVTLINENCSSAYVINIYSAFVCNNYTLTRSYIIATTLPCALARLSKI